MSVPQKSNSLQSYTLLVYRKAVHPEFFTVEGRRRLENGPLEAEAPAALGLVQAALLARAVRASGWHVE